ncbi:hypothetical protein H2199_007351 [Coniosporium tulheliwenetii]|uniref:Uncharacterized protein n=1 Tax=Coniosporium tulheliwenetii TaxID=3383036 RepID=A0ACC2YRS3_9PEZI|nr:hypothetical protein H2199_007351 [Cladosporium sp. JES 115]
MLLLTLIISLFTLHYVAAQATTTVTVCSASVAAFARPSGDGGDDYVTAVTAPAAPAAPEATAEPLEPRQASSDTYTVTVTATKTINVHRVRTRTLAAGCEPTNAILYHAITYAACGSPGLGLLDFEECPYDYPAWFDAADCCTACAKSLNCFQGYSDAASGTCNLSYRTGNIQYNATVFTRQCPMGKTVAVFSDPVRPEESDSGFIRGHCAQSC